MAWKEASSYEYETRYPQLNIQNQETHETALPMKSKSSGGGGLSRKIDDQEAM